MPKKNEILEIVVKIAVLGVVVRTIVQIFFRRVSDDNEQMCLLNDCPGWLVKIQEPRALQVKFSWVAGLYPPGGLQILLFSWKLLVF